MESKLKIIAETADISQQEAELALNLADGDVERAIDLVPYVEKSIVIVHGKFTCGRNSTLKGVFRMVGHGREGLLLDFGLAMSYDKDTVEVPISTNPEAFKKVIERLFKQTENNQVHTFLAGFYEEIGPSKINKMYHLIKDENELELKSLFRDIISSIWGSSEYIKVDLEHYMMTKMQCEKKGIIQPEPEAATQEESDDEPTLSIYLETAPIISPVKGKTIEKFKPGELIPLNIIDEREAGKYLGRMLTEELGFALAKMVDCHYNEGTERYKVEVEFGPKINGRFIIEPSVRLATYSEVEEEVIEDKPEDLNLSVDTMLYIFLGVIIIILFFIIFLR